MREIVNMVTIVDPSIKDITDYQFYDLSSGLAWIYFPTDSVTLTFDYARQIIIGKEVKNLDMMRADVEEFEMVKKMLGDKLKSRYEMEKRFGAVVDDENKDMY